MTTSKADKAREDRLRRKATRQSLLLRKSRVRQINVDNHGGYMLDDANGGFLVAGSRWDLDLDDVAKWLN